RRPALRGARGHLTALPRMRARLAPLEARPVPRRAGRGEERARGRRDGAGPGARAPLPAVAVGAVVGQLSVFDRLLPLWSYAAMALGLALGASFPGLPRLLHSMPVGTVSLPIGVGLLWMMYAVLARLRYEELGRVGRAWRLLGVPLLLNWLIGPLLMFGLAWLFPPDWRDYRTGLILVGLAHCIAVVLVWNHLAGGDREVAAVLVVLNSVFRMLTSSFYAYLFLTVLPLALGLAPAGRYGSRPGAVP